MNTENYEPSWAHSHASFAARQQERKRREERKRRVQQEREKQRD